MTLETPVVPPTLGTEPAARVTVRSDAWWRRHPRLAAAAALLLALLAVLIARGCRSSPPAGARPGRGAGRVVSVIAVPARSADMPIYLDGLGTVTAINTVTVRSRVDGQLVSVNYH